MVLTVWICYNSTEQNHMKKVRWVWPGNTIINPLHHEEEMQSINSHMTLRNQHSLPQRDDCKTRSDTIYCATKQGPCKYKTSQTIGATINNESTTTYTSPYNAQSKILGLKFNFTGQIFALDSAVVKTENNVKLAWRLPYLSTVSSQGNNKLFTVMKQRKWPWTHRQSELKKPTPVEPRWACSKINIRHWPTNESFMPRSSLCLKPNHRKFQAYLITKWRFSLLSMTNEIKIASLKHRLLQIILGLISNFCDFRFWHFQIKKNCILHNTQNIVVKISHMMWIILNICLTTKN